MQSFNLKNLFVLLAFCISANAYSYVDLNVNYSFSKRKVEGIEVDTSVDPGEAITTTTGINAVWAWYLWEYTALEFNYSEYVERLEDDRRKATDDANIAIKNIDSSFTTTVRGVGIRQSFAGRKSRIVPSISIGYAELTTSGLSTYTLVDASGNEATGSLLKDKEVSSSSYASFMLRIKLTQLMGISFMAKTVMPEFNQDEADKNITYSAGFSWMF